MKVQLKNQKNNEENKCKTQIKQKNNKRLQLNGQKICLLFSLKIN